MFDPTSLSYFQVIEAVHFGATLLKITLLDSEDTSYVFEMAFTMEAPDAITFSDELTPFDTSSIAVARK